MGCNRSIPEQIIKSQEPEVSVKEIRGGTRTLTNRFVTKVIGSISEHYKLLKAIGTTSTGTMLLAEDLHTGVLRAIKEVSKSIVKDLPDIGREISILSDLDHPNIVKIVQTVETSINYYIVFEYLSGNTLRLRMKRNGNEIILSRYMRDILSAVYYMHIQGITHCNICPQSILLSNTTEEAVPKLVDFSCSQNILKIKPMDLKKFEYLYVSPEILKKNFSEKTDIWSIGIVIYELLIGKHPYVSKDKHDILKEIYKGEIDFENSELDGMSYNAKDFLKKVLKADPEERLTAKQALDHPWLAQTTKEDYVNLEALQKMRTFKVSDT